MPDVNDKAPDFSLPAGDGRTLSLSDFKGKPLVLYFYPKDDTPGCTQEAIAFSSLAPEFEKAGAAVVGVSRDSVKRHANFAKKHDLAFPLLSDEDGRLCEAFGVWVEKNLYGRTYMGIERSTFLIDGEGVIRRVWRKVKVKGHAEEVLEAVKSLGR